MKVVQVLEWATLILRFCATARLMGVATNTSTPANHDARTWPTADMDGEHIAAAKHLDGTRPRSTGEGVPWLTPLVARVDRAGRRKPSQTQPEPFDQVQRQTRHATVPYHCTCIHIITCCFVQILEDSVPLPGLEPTRGWCAATNARIRVTVVRGIAPDNCRYYTYSMCVHWHIPTLPSRLSICRPSKVFILP